MFKHLHETSRTIALNGGFVGIVRNEHDRRCELKPLMSEGTERVRESKKRGIRELDLLLIGILTSSAYVWLSLQSRIA